MSNISSVLVSVIIPLFNRADYFRESLDSIKRQTHKNFECIIVDDHSTDSSYEIASKFADGDKRFQVFKRPKKMKKGANACRNFGLKKSKGDFIVWFDSDDIMPNNAIEVRLNLLMQSNADFAAGRIANFSETIKHAIVQSQLHLLPQTDNPAFEYVSGKLWYGTPVPLFKRAFLDKIGKFFDPSLKRNQETEFFSRLLMRNPIIAVTEEVVVYRRMHSGSIRATYERASKTKRMLIDCPAFIKIFKNFKNYNFLSEEVENYFKERFWKYFTRMDVGVVDFTRLYFLILRYRLSKSKLLTTAIYLMRLTNSLLSPNRIG